MDTAVALVQAYLNVNGYFTVVEYPVLEARRARPARSVTDLEVLALRFAGTGHQVIHAHHSATPSGLPFEPDPALKCTVDRPDMIVGEVKAGPAHFNTAARDTAVLEVALARFGCCSRDQATDLAHRLLARGSVDSPAGHRVRMVAFGSAPVPGRSGNWTTVPMPHAVEFLRNYLHDHCDVLRHAQIKDPTLGMLGLLEKWGPTRSTLEVRTGSST